MPLTGVIASGSLSSAACLLYRMLRKVDLDHLRCCRHGWVTSGGQLCDMCFQKATARVSSLSRKSEVADARKSGQNCFCHIRFGPGCGHKRPLFLSLRLVFRYSLRGWVPQGYTLKQHLPIQEDSSVSSQTRLNSGAPPPIWRSSLRGNVLGSGAGI